jgi:hypothetical protein
MRALTIIGIASLALTPTAFAQPDASRLEDRLKSINAANLTEADCTSQVASAKDANSIGLIYAGQLCAAVKKPVEASFLLLAGQIRAASDISVMPPATQADDRSLMPLYGMLYYGGGLSGVDDDVLHDPKKRARLLELLDRWTPSYSASYDPGWNPRKRPDAKLYATTVAQGKAELRKSLGRLVRLDSDGQYYALQREHNAIVARIPRSGLPAGTPDSLRLDELQSQMRARGIALGVDLGPPPPDPNKLPTALDTDDSSAADPPASPGKEERAISINAGPIVEKCADEAERTAVSSGGKVSRKQVYISRKWGTVFRADIVGGDFGPLRFTCTENFTGSEPFELRNLQPLPH